MVRHCVVGSSGTVRGAIRPRGGSPVRGVWPRRWRVWFGCRVPLRSAIVGMGRSFRGGTGCRRKMS